MRKFATKARFTVGSSNGIEDVRPERSALASGHKRDISRPQTRLVCESRWKGPAEEGHDLEKAMIQPIFLDLS